MKKIILIITLFTLLYTGFAIAEEEQSEFSVAEKIHSFMLVDNHEALEKVTERLFMKQGQRVRFKSSITAENCKRTLVCYSPQNFIYFGPTWPEVDMLRFSPLE